MDIISHQYIAGLFDGEGSVGLYSNGGSGFGVRVQMVQTETATSRPLWESLQSTYGGGISYVKSDRHRPKMNWALSGSKAIEFLNDILPYVILKRDQVKLLLTWWETRLPLQRDDKGRIVPRTNDERQQAKAVADMLRRMKKEYDSPVS